MPQFGQLTRIDVRELWPNEETDFTPWVASEEGLETLGSCLEFELGLAETEVEVGQYRADIVCTILDSDGTEAVAVIENQLSVSDNEHLGKLLVHGAKQGAKAVIWIAAEFTSEHLAAVAALNSASNGSTDHYCVRVTAWKVDESPAAPAFRALVRPEAAPMAKKAPTPFSEVTKVRSKFWNRLAKNLDAYGMIRSTTPRNFTYQRFELKPKHRLACLSVMRHEDRFMARLYIRGQGHDALFGELKEDRAQIDLELGGHVAWTTKERRSTVDFAMDDFGFYNEDQWGEEIDWAIDKLGLLRRDFEPRLEELTAEAANAN